LEPVLQSAPFESSPLVGGRADNRARKKSIHRIDEEPANPMCGQTAKSRALARGRFAAFLWRDEWQSPECSSSSSCRRADSRPTPASTPQKAAVALAITVKVVSAADGKPIAGAEVVAFTDFANKVGAQAKTDGKGVAALKLGGSSKKVERLYIYARMGFWNALKKNVTLSSGTTIPMRPIDLGYTDSLRHFYP